MRKAMIFLTLVVCSASSAWAQTVYEAITMMDNEYSGTARSAALGNAVSALGGDIGMIEINPAGSAVANYSQAAISPNLNFGRVNATYAPVGAYSPNFYQGETGAAQDTRMMFTMPNVGFTININNGRSGMKNFSFSFVANSTGVLNDVSAVGGVNDCFTSMTGSLSSQCSGYYPEALSAQYNSSIYWPYQLAYKAGMVRYLSGTLDQYAGAAEIWDETYMVGAPLEQSYTRERRGTKTDMLFNFAANFDDKLYVGLNVGAPTSSQSTTLTSYENALNSPGTPCDIVYELDGELVRFKQTKYTQWENINTTGIYAKLGAIFVPVRWLRLAATIQTPTSTRVSRRVQWDAYTDFSKVASGSPLSFTSRTPEGEEQYRIIAPFRYNFGAAFMIGQFMLVSADWESANFSQMRFQGVNGSDTYREVNESIVQCAGSNNSIRVGLEVKPLPKFSIRGGYNCRSNFFCGERDVTNVLSCGLGYASNGSFFCDLAARFTKYPTEYYYPYADYIFDEDGNVYCGTSEVKFNKKMMDIVFTIGWRF